jgi:CBS domain-containing protein
MIVRELMTGAVITAPPWTPILEARSLMMKERIRHLPVAAADGRLLGIITDRDIRLIASALLVAVRSSRDLVCPGSGWC